MKRIFVFLSVLVMVICQAVSVFSEYTVSGNNYNIKIEKEKKEVGKKVVTILRSPESPFVGVEQLDSPNVRSALGRIVETNEGILIFGNSYARDGYNIYKKVLKYDEKSDELMEYLDWNVADHMCAVSKSGIMVGWDDSGVTRLEIKDGVVNKNVLINKEVYDPPYGVKSEERGVYPENIYTDDENFYVLSEGRGNIILRKYDSEGNLLWKRNIKHHVKKNEGIGEVEIRKINNRYYLILTCYVDKGSGKPKKIHYKFKLSLKSGETKKSNIKIPKVSKNLFKVVGKKKIYMTKVKNGYKFKYGKTTKYLKGKTRKFTIKDCTLKDGRLIVTGYAKKAAFGGGAFKNFEAKNYYDGFVVSM